MGRPKVQKQHSYRNDADFNDGASTSDAMSLHSNIGVIEPDEDEHAPPPYADDENVPMLAPNQSAARNPPADLDERVESWVAEDWKGSRYTRLSPTLTTDPVALEKYIQWEACQAPKAYIRIQGHHSETHKNRDNGTKTERVEDFDFKADVRDTFCEGRGEPWNSLQMIENEVKEYRGTLIKTRNPRFKADDDSTHGVPSLLEWCHLFCASSAPLKSFTLRREIVGRNEKYITQEIIALLRQTNYRGSITVTFPLHDRSVTIISPHPFNRLRNNRFVWWIFVILQLWIIAWPVLFFMTKRWEVATGQWEYSRDGWNYWKLSEEAWCGRWSSTIQRAALSRMKGGTEIQVPANELEDRERRRMEEEARARQSGFVVGTLALVRGISDITRESNTSLGWGYNT